MDTVFLNAVAITPFEQVDDCKIVVTDGRIAQFGKTSEVESPAGARVIDLAGSYITPGLIDVQINGGGGYMFSTAIEADAYMAILRAHASLGTTSVCPTIISGPMVEMVEAIKLCASLTRSRNDAAAASIVGVHVEGPFLSERKRGGHALENLAAPDRVEARRLIDAAEESGGRVAIFTLAPELPGALEIVESLVERGVFVSLGHSSGSAADFSSAFDAGARGVTHLFNAMEGMSSRVPGGVGAALARPDVYAGLIADLLHVDAVSLKAAINARGSETTYLTTDAVSPLGSSDESFDLYGVTVTVRDGGCYTADGVLAGTATPLSRMVRNLVESVGVDVVAAVRMATYVPALVAGVVEDRGELAPGKRADLVVWSPNLEPQSVWIDGAEVAGSLTSIRS